ncbi:hypothetical protein BDR26DRAFT_420245 [Obelidium mucronatum]|nr:hypothetical protein BDR26DRAFT_420245 [Obelidium mucronatum]
MDSLLSRQSPIATPPRMKLSIPSLQHCIAPNHTPTDIILMNSLLLPLDQSQFHFSESDLLHAHLGNMDLMTPSPMILPRNENNASSPNQQLTKPVSLDGVMDSPPQSPNPPPTISPKKNKKMRFRATEAELDFLLTVFESNPFPSTRQRIQLAEKLSLDPKQILFWFQNRRATLKSNGIVAVKPKKTAAATSLAFRGKNCTLSPLSAENPFFYVAETSE